MPKVSTPHPQRQFNIMITLHLDDRAVIEALERLRARAGAAGLRPALALCAEYMVESTKRRFASSSAPDGSAWAANAPATLERKRGGRPLVQSGQLARSIRWQYAGDGVEIGTDRFASEWRGGAAVHQFGSRDGRIPARPFLGFSHDDVQALEEIIAAHLEQP